jgi:hypothetical protein
MKNWIYYQMAMYYLRKARNVPDILHQDSNLAQWERYMEKSRQWIGKINF